MKWPTRILIEFGRRHQMGRSQSSEIRVPIVAHAFDEIVEPESQRLGRIGVQPISSSVAVLRRSGPIN